MNLFFGLDNDLFYSNLAIPKFSYQNVYFKNPLLCVKYYKQSMEFKYNKRY